MATLQVSRPDLETPLSSTLLTYTDLQEMDVNDKKVVAIICPQVSPGAYYPRCVSGSSSAFTQNGITASGSDSELDATVSSIYSEPTAHFVLTKTGISTYTLRSVGYNFYSPRYDAEETNGLAWVEIPEEFTLSSPIISDTTGIAVNPLASNSSFIRFTESTAGKILSAGADASEFGFSSADDITSVWYVYEINGYVAEDLYTVTCKSNNTGYGVVTGAGNYTGGSSVTVEANAVSGGRFIGWTDGDTRTQRTFIISADTLCRANFVSATQGLIYFAKENLVTMWNSIKSYFSATTGASHIGVDYNNAVGATTVADVVGSIGQASGIATLDSTGKLDSNQLPSGLLSGTVGSTTTPVYLDNGTITAVGTSLAVDITGSAAKVGTATVGGSTQPVYMNAGTPTACGTSLAVDITGNAATATSATTASSCSGNATTATTATNANNLKVTHTGAAWRDILSCATGFTSASNQAVYGHNSGSVAYYVDANATSGDQRAILRLGNATANTTAAGHNGELWIYGTSTLALKIKTNPEANKDITIKTTGDTAREYTLPDAAGTIALTSSNITGSSASCTGNAATATTASKLGSSTIGSSTQPIYLNAGTPTACGFKIEKVSQAPANPDSNTIYIIVS